MAKSNVLYIHVTGLSSEILKNLVLAGVRAVLCDGRPFAALAATPTFFLHQGDRSANRLKAMTVAQVMKEKVEELNPLLGDCEIYNTAVKDLTDDFLQKFSIVICSHVGISDAVRISKAVTSVGNKFYMADCFGMNGAAAMDLGADYMYRPELGKKLLDMTGLKAHVPLETVLMKVPLDQVTNRFHKIPPAVWIQYLCILEYVERTQGTWPSDDKAADFATIIQEWIAISAPSLKDNPVLTTDALQDLAKLATAEVAPVCSVLGGILGNEVIKVISGKGEPANNVIFFDGSSCKCWNFLVEPKQ